MNKKLDTLFRIIREQNPYAHGEQMSPETKLVTDLHLDSISIMATLIAIEKEFNCRLDFSLLPNNQVSTISDILKLTENVNLD